jgi:hypothetical protein
MQMLKTFTLAALVGLSALSFDAAAHGDAKPRHGGVVQSAADLEFELVAQGGKAALFVVDHGKPADASKFSGKLTVLKGTERSEAELKPAGGNRLEAAVPLDKGAKVVATVTLPGGKGTTVRFTVK